MNVLTQRNDSGRSGVNAAEDILTPGNVNVNSFGLVRNIPIGLGSIYAQPLYVAQLRFPNGQVCDTIFVATMENCVLALDAESGAILAQTHVDNKPAVETHTWFGAQYNDIVNAQGEKPPTIGILSTPVIDLARNELFLVLFTVDETKANTLNTSGDERAAAFEYILCALDLTTLQTKRSAVIGGSVSGTGYASSARAAATPDFKETRMSVRNGTVQVTTKMGSKGGPLAMVAITDATGIQSHDPRVRFNAMTLLQRPALLLDNGVIFIAFGSRGDNDPWHGWIFAYNETDFTRIDLLCTTPNGAQGGIWQAGQGLLADAQHNVYAGTGNGDSNQPKGVPGTPNMGESFLKLRVVDGRLEVVGWYNAFNDLDYRDASGGDEVVDKDDDLGASAPALLPDERIVGGGKDGYFYLIDSDELIGDAAARQEQPAADRVVLQYFLASFNYARGTRGVAQNVIPEPDADDVTHHIHGSPVVWHGDNNHTLVYVWGENDVTRTYRYALRPAGQPLGGGFADQGAIAVAPLITSDWRHVIPVHGIETARGMTIASNEYPGRNGMPGGFLSLSWNGRDRASAILWGIFPPFKNGNVFRVEGELIAYDASNFDTQSNFSRLQAVWRSRQDPDVRFKLPKFCCPTVAGGKVFVPSGDGAVLSVYGLRNHGGGYDLARDAYTAGFGGTGGLTLNGTARVSVDKKIILTDNPIQPNPGADSNDRVGQAFIPTFQSGSAFCTQPVDVTDLATRFTFSMNGVDPMNMADGLTFTIQAAGPHALGSPGSGLGYAIDPLDTSNTGARIARSLAITFDVVLNKLSLWRDGANGGPWIYDLGANGIALNSAHPIRVTLKFSHAAKTLTLGIEELDNPQAKVGPLTLENIDLIGFLKLGTPALAYIGFTGGTGAKSAEQTILDWSVP
ncbi:lectin-like domain-containing protein [Paraburkholderia sp. MM5477-R1]|uniref:lectin-like domain-containing protein n=1 Tax=Paraburkholderia sp. MM5477-R1 TaxID=2991062 RepID=UPI003D25C8F0